MEYVRFSNENIKVKIEENVRGCDVFFIQTSCPPVNDHLMELLIALDALNVDRIGLDEMDNRILETMIDKFGGGPVGVSTIATAVGENAGTLEEVYEPFLIQEGLLVRTPRGRQVTEAAYVHLGRTQRARDLFGS